MGHIQYICVGPFSCFWSKYKTPQFPLPPAPPTMVLPPLFRPSVILRTSPSYTDPSSEILYFSIFHVLKSTLALSNASEPVSQQKNEKGSNRWFTLPPYTATVNASILGNRILNRGAQAEVETSTAAITALKWVIHCCPELPRSLVQKLFRLRKVPSSISLNTMLNSRN